MFELDEVKNKSGNFSKKANETLVFLKESDCKYDSWRDWISLMIIKDHKNKQRKQFSSDHKNLTAKFSEITSSGLITIKMSDTIHKPCFLENKNSSLKRLLKES